MLQASKLCACHRVFASLLCPALSEAGPAKRTRKCSTAMHRSEISKQKTVNLPHNQNENNGNVRPHIPVMLQETIEMLAPRDGQVFIDMTFGAGGHTEAILNEAKGTRVYALDRDPVAFGLAKEMALKYRGRVFPMLGKFSDLDAMFQQQGIPKNSIDGVLFDVGVSSMQMDDPGRGFALSKNGPLDMRMDKDRIPNQPTARDVINTLDETSLGKIFKVYGEEKAAYRVANAIIDARFMMKRIDTTEELAALVQAAMGSEAMRLDQLRRPSHVATKIFQALRIFVNNELNELNHGMEVAHAYLRPGGTLAALTFHSLEDRIVKRHIMGIDMDEPAGCTIHMKYKNAGVWLSDNEMHNYYSHRWTAKNKTVITPGGQEVAANPRSRSAKLRAAVKKAENEEN